MRNLILAIALVITLGGCGSTLPPIYDMELASLLHVNPYTLGFYKTDDVNIYVWYVDGEPQEHLVIYADAYYLNDESVTLEVVYEWVKSKTSKIKEHDLKIKIDDYLMVPL